MYLWTGLRFVARSFFLMDQRIKYDFRDRQNFIFFLLPLLLLPVWFSIRFFLLFKIAVFYVLPAWILFCLSFISIRVTDHSIIIVKYLKPFKKIYRYAYKDLLGVSVGDAKGIRILFIFPGKKTFSASMPYNREHVCKFFLDKGIKVGSGDEDLKHFINHYHNDPKANYIRQQVRKAKRKNTHLNT